MKIIICDMTDDTQSPEELSAPYKEITKLVRDLVGDRLTDYVVDMKYPNGLPLTPCVVPISDNSFEVTNLVKEINKELKKAYRYQVFYKE